MTEKVIVTNWSALKAKYGNRIAEVDGAIQKLIASDKKRGIATRLLALDRAADMKSVGAAAVTSSKSEKQNKRAIDKIDAQLSPDYIMILGSIDVVPHQSLKNPVYEPGADDDKYAYSDLPYACDAPYSQDPAKFIGPTRVVGRLPDITGSTDPSYLVRLLTNASMWQSLPSKAYNAGMGVSAAVWKGSTILSMKALFGGNSKPRLSPTEGPKWPSSLLSRRAHFINCHGALADPRFYGQKGTAFPVAHDASLIIKAKVSPGTVAAIECCYGAELYAPEDTHLSIANTYLGSGAWGYFGSTTIAYGPADSNGAADLICQYFLKSALNGASLGRAALEARQKFAEETTELDPIDLKTLVQFILLGDPSIHPVQAKTATTKTRTLTPEAGDSFERDERRRSLLAKGVMIQQSLAVARRSKVQPSTQEASILARLAAERLGSPRVLSFEIERRNPRVRSALRKGHMAEKSPSAFHVVMGHPKSAAAAKTRAAPGIQRVIAFVAKSVNGKIVSVRELQAK